MGLGLALRSPAHICPFFDLLIVGFQAIFTVHGCRQRVMTAMKVELASLHTVQLIRRIKIPRDTVRRPGRSALVLAQ